MRALTASVAIATALASTACYTMRPVTLDNLPPRVWVTYRNQSVIVVDRAKLHGGNLVGFVDGRYRELNPADVQQLRARSLATGRTVSLVVAGALGFAVGVVLISGSEDYFQPCVGDADCSSGL